MAEVRLNVSNFETEVLQAEGLVLVDFWADWCGPCKMLAPVVEDIAKEHPEIKVGKVNIDETIELAQKYRVASIPTLLLFKDGEVVKQSVGYVGKKEIEAMLG